MAGGRPGHHPAALRRGDGAGSGDPADASNRRYVLGQQLYVRKVAPARHATRVVDNDDLAAPVLVR